ncbi:major facilitator superfamily domain-containing protein [Lineolata rhizophorae]|uniref:Major facilitator superfamily domain-containing protein n=1 Tax=Lineolata rhizophorae TaxID=578093 RepID=A0A6A6PE80_9PEZI|nr:major facilitator superfamily domain-containing protein [Lineolata rhizophorae]
MSRKGMGSSMDEQSAFVAPSHLLSPSDPDNPMNWPTHRRIYVSAASWAFGFTIAFGLTAYTAGIPEVVEEFDVTMTEAILGMSLYLWGIVFAPIYTPHLSERYGRSIIYLVSTFTFAFFTLGVAEAKNFATVAICRFFAGLTGGPCLVLIEGTFADIWSADLTNTYYAFLGLSSYLGAAAGPIIGGFVVAARGWRWTQWVTMVFACASLLFGLGMNETYGREIPRRRNRYQGRPPPKQPPAESGVTLSQMVRITVITPLVMAVTEPVVIMCTIMLGFSFAVIFQWFITVPVVLMGVYGFTLQQAGLAFFAAVGGALLAALTAIMIEQLLYRRISKNGHSMLMNIEYRLIPSMIGVFMIPGSLFWIGFTADPSIHYLSPILGTTLYVWGNLMIVISMITYLFDAYPPAGTLSALTLQACLRLALAGFLPLVILTMFTDLTGKWALSIFGFISIPLIAIPFILFKFGARMRMRSKYSAGRMVVPVPSQEQHEPMMRDVELETRHSTAYEGAGPMV